MIHSSLHIENLLKTNNAAKIAAQEIQKTNTRGKWESEGAGLNSTACCILPIFRSSYQFIDPFICLQPPGKVTALLMTSQRATQLSELLSGPFDFFFFCLFVFVHVSWHLVPLLLLACAVAAKKTARVQSSKVSFVPFHLQRWRCKSISGFFRSFANHCFFFLRLQITAGSSELVPRRTFASRRFAKH